MSCPSAADFGEAVTLNSGGRAGAVRTVLVLLLLPPAESLVSLVTVTLFEMFVPLGASLFTFTTIVNVAVSPFATAAFVKVTLPVPPTAGEVVVQPPGAVADTNVVFAGKESTTE